MYTYRRDPFVESFTSSLEKVLLLIGNLVLTKTSFSLYSFNMHPAVQTTTTIQTKKTHGQLPLE